MPPARASRKRSSGASHLHASRHPLPAWRVSSSMPRFGFWKGSLILDKNGARPTRRWASSGGCHSIKDLPAKAVLAGYIRKAMQLNDDGVKVVRPKTKPKPRPRRRRTCGPRSRRTRRRSRPSGIQPEQAAGIRRVDHRGENRSDATQALATAVGWIAEGKSRNWKYVNC